MLRGRPGVWETGLLISVVTWMIQALGRLAPLTHPLAQGVAPPLWDTPVPKANCHLPPLPAPHLVQGWRRELELLGMEAWFTPQGPGPDSGTSWILSLPVFALGVGTDGDNHLADTR